MLLDAMKTFRPPKGFYKRVRRNESAYFAFRATLRIFGDGLDFAAISSALGVEPTSHHRRGERRSATAEPYPHDLWSYTVPVKESEPLHQHIDALWRLLAPQTGFLLMLKESAVVDVFLGYRSNCDHAGIEVPAESLAMFQHLQIPFNLSVIIN